MVASFPHGGIAAEIGVQRGDFADTIIRVNEPKDFYLIDCWEHQDVTVYGHDPANVPDEVHEGLYELVKQRFSSHPEVHIIRAYSVDAAKEFVDAYFDWIYLDANHLNLRADLEAWWPKIKPGGWCAGHDYCYHDDYIMVKPVVDHWVREYGLELHVMSDAAEKDFPSWAFQKP
jgi:predicted O-methyltransferase YrrM